MTLQSVQKTQLIDCGFIRIRKHGPHGHWMVESKEPISTRGSGPHNIPSIRPDIDRLAQIHLDAVTRFCHTYVLIHSLVAVARVT